MFFIIPLISLVYAFWRMDAMSEVLRTFGNNAGKLWETLEEYGPSVQKKLMKKTQLTEDEFYGAIGWLARENKIRKDKRTYKIGETNLISEIGTNAGKVWEVLKKRSDIDIVSICQLSKVQKKDCYSALGWLARENKISAKISVRKK
jgi:hypothetical protein